MRAALALLVVHCFLANLCCIARGHFVWLDVVENDRTGAQAEVYFSETADPGEPHLIEKIAGTKLSVRTAESAASQPVVLKVLRGDLSGKLVGSAPDAKSYCLTAVCDYGVVERGGQSFLLQYYAKHIQSDSAQAPDRSRVTGRTPLDIQVEQMPTGFTCKVVWNDKPIKNAEVVIQFPEGDSIERKTDEHGQVVVTTKTKGRFALRTRHVEAGKSGVRDGKQYAEVRHYATLTCALTGVPADPAKAQDGTAAGLLSSARKARAVWNDFPGFSANLAVRYNEEEAAGKVIVTADGDVVLKMPKFSGAAWLQSYLESVVQHRMPGDPANEDVRFLDDGSSHPLGRKIALGDGDQDSMYRIKDDVVREVNRRAGPGRFTISVLETKRNADGKYLPLVYSMTFWNGDGKVTSTSTTQDSWARVGKFDLPLRTIQVTATDDGRDVKLLEFSSHALMAAETASK